MSDARSTRNRSEASGAPPVVDAAPAPPVAGAPRTDRRQAILLAAERLFAHHGFHGVTIRAIAQAAEVPLALVGYYFGAKHDLFVAIFEHWQPTIQARLDALAQVRLDPADGATLPAIVRAFTEPVLALRGSADGEFYALLVARQLYVAGAEADEVLRRHFDPLAHAFIAALQQAVPGADRAQVAWCYQFMLGALLHHLSDTRVEALSLGAARAADPAAAPLLQRFIVGGLRAALAPPADADASSHDPSRRHTP